MLNKPKFGQNERLKRKGQFDYLMRNGKRLNHAPFRVVYILSNESESTQIAISVSKKFFKHAVDRNKIKRRVQNAYRLNKIEFKNNSKYLILFIFQNSTISSYQIIEASIIAILNKIYNA